MALDILQGEENCFYGTILPTLEALMAKTLDLKDSFSWISFGLPDVIVEAIKTRFASTLDSKEALLAALTNPKFKLRWIKDETRKDATKVLLAAECRALGPLLEELPPAPVSGSDAAEIDFFSFTEDRQVSETVDTEIAEYFKSGVEIDMLNKFPRIKTVFLHFNTPPPSSAPMERPFNLGSLVLTPRRNPLSDKRFENLLLLRFNHYFEEQM